MIKSVLIDVSPLDVINLIIGLLKKDNFEKAFDANIFTKDYSLNGGIKPDDKVLAMLIKIKNNIEQYKKSKTQTNRSTIVLYLFFLLSKCLYLFDILFSYYKYIQIP